jgi:hypothetical protein
MTKRSRIKKETVQNQKSPTGTITGKHISLFSAWRRGVAAWPGGVAVYGLPFGHGPTDRRMRGKVVAVVASGGVAWPTTGEPPAVRRVDHLLGD